MPWAIETAAWRSFPQITAFVYGELQSTGNLSLVSSESLRRDLAEHYQKLQHDSRVGLDLEAQRLYEQATAGVLTTEELVAVENASWGDQPAEVDPARSAEIVAALRNRDEAIALLPSLVQHHTFNIKAIQSAIERAQLLITKIDALVLQFKES